MRWPFITRTTMEKEIAARDALIARMEQKLNAMEQERKLLFDQIVFRHSRLHLYPEFEPARSEPVVAQPEAKKGFMEQTVPTSVNEAIAAGVSANPRNLARAYETYLAEKHRMNVAKGVPEVRQRIADEVAQLGNDTGNGIN